MEAKVSAKRKLLMVEEVEELKETKEVKGTREKKIKKKIKKVQKDVLPPSRKKKDKPVRQLKDLSLRELYLFYSYKAILRKEPEIADMLYGIDMCRKPISNRGLEHFATNYSRKYDIRIDEHGNDDAPYGEFYVADEYHKHLPKTDTDPCCRGALIEYVHKGKTMKTTIPQLGSNISICRSPGIKYAEKQFLAIRMDLDIDKGIKKIKPRPGVVLPKVKIRAVHHMIPLTTVINL